MEKILWFRIRALYYVIAFGVGNNYRKLTPFLACNAYQTIRVLA